MAIRTIREKGDPCLEKVCRPVTEFNARLHQLLDDMADTLGIPLISSPYSKYDSCVKLYLAQEAEKRG